MSVKNEIVIVTHLNEKGQGIGKTKDGKEIIIWNSLPQEEIEIEIRKRKGRLEGTILNILKPSPYRIQEKEDHFLSCSPWQILDFTEEQNLKLNTIKTLFKDIYINYENIEIYSDYVEYGYRNKMEFSFTQEDKIKLALFKREGKTKLSLNKCVLAKENLNKTAQIITEYLNKQQIEVKDIKSLIVRENEVGETIAALFLKKEELNIDTKIQLESFVKGFEIYYSTHKSPASVPTKLIYQIGKPLLETKIHNTKLTYGIFSFFQVNIPVFEEALKDISNNLESNKEIIDFYSGVGSISLPLRHSTQGATLIDNNEDSINFAHLNIQNNSISNTNAQVIAAEKITEVITKEKTIILDPPRIGLHMNVINKLRDIIPSKIIYLSCNPYTQHRDILLLKDLYDIKMIRAYNFFPHTAHIENLCVLEKK